MLVPVFIDTSDIAEQFEGVTQDNINNLCDNIAKGLAAGFAMQLEEEAQKELHQTKKVYIQNIKLVDSGKLEGVVLLDYSKNPLVRMIEEGASPFDIKNGLLNSKKVKFTKDGRKYITVPFRIATSGAVGESDVFNGVMPEAVYQVIKDKVANIPVKGGGNRTQGLQSNEIPSEFALPKTRQTINNSEGNPLWAEYKHKNSIYEGLTRVEDTVTGQSTYHSFRRVSEPRAEIIDGGKKVGSDPNSWIHPGIQAHHLIQTALNNYNVEEKTGELLNIELSKLGFEVE